MIERRLQSTVLDSLAKFPVVGLIGARQVGKTTLAHSIAARFPGAIYLDLERPTDAAKLTEATGIVNKLKAQNVEVVFQASYPADGILIQRAMKQLRLNLFANVHPAGAPPNTQYVANLKDDANHVYTALGWTASMFEKLPPGARATVEQYRKVHGVDVQDQAGYSLSAAAAMVDALGRARSLDRAALWEAVKTVDISFGKDPSIIIPYGVKWDEKHDNAKAQAIMTQISDQKLVVVYPKDLAQKNPVFPAPKWEERA